MPPHPTCHLLQAHHQAQALFLEQFSPDSAQPLLAALHELDCARVAAALGAVQVKLGVSVCLLKGRPLAAGLSGIQPCCC